MDLDGLGINLQSLLLVDEKLLHDISLVALKLDHVTGLFIVDYGAIAGELLLNDLEDLLEVELGWNALDGGQGLAAIALLNAYVDIRLGRLLSRFSSILILRIRKGIERFEVLNLTGHTMLLNGFRLSVG